MKTIHDIEIRNLIEKAQLAYDRAYAPYSHFNVGACLKGQSGAYYFAGNVENASYSVSICAERGALSRAIYEGEREFDAIAIYTKTDAPIVPCGMCLQALCEFCKGDMPVICACDNEYKVYALEELLPQGFRVDN